MVPEAGIEPARYFYRGILSPLRLPISPPGQCGQLRALLYRPAPLWKVNICLAGIPQGLGLGVKIPVDQKNGG